VCWSCSFSGFTVIDIFKINEEETKNWPIYLSSSGSDIGMWHMLLSDWKESCFLKKVWSKREEARRCSVCICPHSWSCNFITVSVVSLVWQNGKCARCLRNLYIGGSSSFASHLSWRWWLQRTPKIWRVSTYDATKQRSYRQDEGHGEY
jgi:hypothetical protein